MNLAILKYQYVPYAPSGIPADWPAEVRELGESTTLPGESWVLMTTEEYAAYRAARLSSYNTWEAAYDPAINKVVQGRIQSAKDFGSTLMVEYATSNVLAGFNVSQIQDIMNRTQKVADALNSGSLYVAIEELNALTTDATLITPAKVTTYRNKIQRYLGLPLT